MLGLPSSPGNLIHLLWNFHLKPQNNVTTFGCLLGRFMILATQNSLILQWTSTAFVQMQLDMMTDILWGPWAARGMVICCCTMVLDTYGHLWASWVQNTAVVDT